MKIIFVFIAKFWLSITFTFVENSIVIFHIFFIFCFFFVIIFQVHRLKYSIDDYFQLISIFFQVDIIDDIINIIERIEQNFSFIRFQINDWRFLIKNIFENRNYYYKFHNQRSSFD